MPITLGTNIASLGAQRALAKSSSALSSTLQRLSSGLRINTASDDAAGLAVSSQLSAGARVFSQAIRNVNDGISVASIAEGALTSLSDISQRQLELATQAANGTYSLNQRQALNTEANKLVDEFNRIVASTTFNGINLFDPNLGSIVLQAGSGPQGTLSFDLSNILKRAVGDGTFASGQVLPFGISAPNQAISADFNGDGKVDLVTANLISQDLSIFLGNGDGTFTAARTFTFDTDKVTVATADFNGDGKLDLISGGVDNVSIILGNGDGSFRAPVSIAGLGASASVGISDLNGDGKSDFVSVDMSGNVIVFQGNGNGTFRAAQTLASGSGSQHQTVAIGDFNGDGRFDLLTSGYNGKASLFLGTGTGTFQSARTINGGNGQVAAADFNNDGRLDFIMGNLLLIGNGDGTFQAGKTIGSGLTAFPAAVMDFNGDGIPDFAAMDATSLVTFLGNGDGTFTATNTVSTGGSPFMVYSADLGGDGRSDIVISSPLLGGSAAIYTGLGGYTTASPYLNINTQAGARDALGTVRGTMDRINAQLGALGAATSRFTYAINTLSVTRENYLAAASRIQDADIADESSSLIRLSLLQQAGASVLSHVNLDPQLALQLLRG